MQLNPEVIYHKVSTALNASHLKICCKSCIVCIWVGADKNLIAGSIQFVQLHVICGKRKDKLRRGGGNAKRYSMLFLPWPVELTTIMQLMKVCITPWKTGLHAVAMPCTVVTAQRIAVLTSLRHTYLRLLIVLCSGSVSKLLNIAFNPWLNLRCIYPWFIVVSHSFTCCRYSPTIKSTDLWFFA